MHLWPALICYKEGCNFFLRGGRTCITNHQPAEMSEDRAGRNKERNDDHPEYRGAPRRDLPASDFVVWLECVGLNSFRGHQGEY